MFAARSLARAIPRTLRAVRPAVPMMPVRTFAFSAIRAEASGNPSSLSSVLSREIQFETDMAKNEQVSPIIAEFLADKTWSLNEVPRSQETHLVREYQNEKITVVFGQSDYDITDPYDEDYSEEDGEGVPEESAEESDEDLEDGFHSAQLLKILIEKPGQTEKVMAISATISTDSVQVTQVALVDSMDQAINRTADAAHARNNLYIGPEYEQLDEDFQVAIESFLEKRGINNALATFIPEYNAIREQSQYVRWLQDIQDFNTL